MTLSANNASCLFIRYLLGVVSTISLTYHTDVTLNSVEDGMLSFVKP